jgi:hypothetical protein
MIQNIINCNKNAWKLFYDNIQTPPQSVDSIRDKYEGIYNTSGKIWDTTFS